jgi:hypothetical protein
VDHVYEPCHVLYANDYCPIGVFVFAHDCHGYASRLRVAFGLSQEIKRGDAGYALAFKVDCCVTMDIRVAMYAYALRGSMAWDACCGFESVRGFAFASCALAS